MKIMSSNLAMNATHSYQESFDSKSTLVTRKVVRPNDEGQQQVQAPQAAVASELEAVKADELELSEEDKVKLALIKRLFKQLTGKELDIIDREAFAKSLEESGNVDELNVAQGGEEQLIEFYQKYSESERMDFAAKGEITTQSGQVFNVDFSMSLSREFVAESYMLLVEAQPTDPLVINFSGQSAKLSERETAFDLNSDDVEEQIAFLGRGSGFLALDKNNDNIINDGSELFGPTNGNGFQELADYDKDDNGWIDENDEIFGSLKIWAEDFRGNKQLYSLADKGIGAISLSQVETAFTYKNKQNQSLGEVATTGVALKETGEAVTVQQINLFV